jgi:elongation factor 1 alpha-like protein
MQESDKTPLTLVILGHVDAGKSTITGRLLHSASHGRMPTNFAWLLDEDEKERQHGVTMDIATKQFTTPKFDIVLQDAPGHADFVPAMITGTSAADATLLVVDATDFGTGFVAGQLKEHVYLAKGLGVQQVLVVVNKMDVVEWKQEKFEEIRTELGRFLNKVGYSENKIRYVPVSGLVGTNIIKSSNECDWYKGPTLLQALDGFDPPVQQQQKLLEKPLRMILTDVLSEQGKGVAVRAKVAQGWLQSGDSLVVLPIGDETTITKLSSLQSNASASTERYQYAAAGEMIDCVLQGMDIMRTSTGNVLCSTHQRPPMSQKCLAKIWVLEGTLPIIRGAQVLFHMHHLDVPCHLSSLIRTFNFKDGSVLKERPRALTSNTQAEVELTLSVPIVMEAFADCRALGRFVLRRGGDSVAVGRILQVLPTS